MLIHHKSWETFLHTLNTLSELAYLHAPSKPLANRSRRMNETPYAQLITGYAFSLSLDKFLPHRHQTTIKTHSLALRSIRIE